MRTETVLLVCVVVVGYSLYGAMAIAGGLVTDQSSSIDEELPDDAATEAPGREPNGSQFQFREVSEETGFEYEYRTEYTGGQAVVGNGGVYTTDYDGDGWTDVLAVGGEVPVLFENRNGEFHRSGALPPLNRSFRSALFFDQDNDGRDDLLLLPKNGTPVFLENRGGAFARADVGLDVDLTMSMGATAGDYTGNGCLDLFIIQYGDWLHDHPEGLRNYSVPLSEDNGNRNLLFRNTCSEFVNATAGSGVRGTGWSLATSMVDLSGDGSTDIYVANDYNVDVVYLNQGDGTFERRELGNRTNRNGMSSQVLDIDGDGMMDVFVTNIWFPDIVVGELENTSTMDIRAEGNNLLINQGNGTFAERAEQYQVLRGGWAWAAVAADFDNDMDRDLFHTTRQMSFSSPLIRYSEKQIRAIKIMHTFYDYPVLFEGTSTTFRRVFPSDAGFVPSDGRGVARLDFDRDGREDLVMANASGSYNLYRNVGRAENGVAIRLSAPAGQTEIGARVHVTAEDATQTQAYNAKTDFLSQDSRTLHFGAGNATRVEVSIVWPDGTEQVLEDVRTGQRIVVTPTGITERVDFNPRSRASVSLFASA